MGAMPEWLSIPVGSSDCFCFCENRPGRDGTHVRCGASSRFMRMLSGYGKNTQFVSLRFGCPNGPLESATALRTTLFQLWNGLMGIVFGRRWQKRSRGRPWLWQGVARWPSNGSGTAYGNPKFGVLDTRRWLPRFHYGVAY